MLYEGTYSFYLFSAHFLLDDKYPALEKFEYVGIPSEKSSTLTTFWQRIVANGTRWRKRKWNCSSFDSLTTRRDKNGRVGDIDILSARLTPRSTWIASFVGDRGNVVDDVNIIKRMEFIHRVEWVSEPRIGFSKLKIIPRSPQYRNQAEIWFSFNQLTTNSHFRCVAWKHDLSPFVVPPLRI